VLTPHVLLTRVTPWPCVHHAGVTAHTEVVAGVGYDAVVYAWGIGGASLVVAATEAAVVVAVPAAATALAMLRSLPPAPPCLVPPGRASGVPRNLRQASAHC
jgi:hypothetical protein